MSTEQNCSHKAGNGAIMHRVSLESSNIATAAFARETLFLEFHSGQVYKYDNVPRALYDGLISADSAGQYFHHHIKGKFHYTRLESNPFEEGRQTVAMK